MTDSTKPSTPESRLCDTCKINPVVPYKIGPKWIYPLICSSCRDVQYLDWVRQVNEQKEKKRRLINRQRLTAVIPLCFRSAAIESLPKELQKEIQGLPTHKGLFLFGPVGCGKTYTLAAIARQRIESNVWPVEFENWERFLYRLRAYYGGKTGEADKLLLQRCKAAALFLDDLSIAGSESEFSLRTLYTILDTRIENNLPTFFASNRNPDEIGKAFDPRIASRLKGHCHILCYNGPDRRLPPASRGGNVH